MNRILLIGSGFSGVTEYLQANNYDYIILKDRLTTRTPDKKLKRQVVCDFSSRESVLAAVDSINKEITAVMTVYENYVLATAWIAEHLGLPGMPVEAAKACTDKWLMRQTFAKAETVINPDFTIVNNEQDLRGFAASHDFPLMLKPANLVKSLLVSKSNSSSELLANYRTMMGTIDRVYQKYAPGRQPTVIIEEFLRGSMHSVAAFADIAGEPHLVEPIVDLYTARDIGYDDNFLYNRMLPSRLSAEEQQAIRDCARVGVRALGMQTSPAHIEIILTDKGPRIVEIGARIGGYRERMYRLANDIDMVRAAVDIAIGRQPNLEIRTQQPVAVLELFPKQPGNFVAIDHEEMIKSLPSCIYFAVKAKPGGFVGKAADGHKRSAIVILHHSNKAQLDADLAIVQKKAQVLTESIA